MLKELFKPYAEYTLRTTLSEEELIAGLKRECGSSFFWKTCFFSREKVFFTAKFPKGRILLTAHCRMRNPPVLHITTETPFRGEGLILHISILPENMRLFLFVWYVFLLLHALLALGKTGKWFLSVFYAVMALMPLLIWGICRSMVTERMPLIRSALESLLRKMEEQR